MKVAIVGSRKFEDLQMVSDYVHTLPNDTIIVSGGAIGVDIAAQKAAAKCGLETHVYIPQWSKYGKSAGMIRNSDIVAACDRLVAFWDGKSKGTKNSIDKARKAGKPVVVIEM